MERSCQRVQRSVFECPLDEETINRKLEKYWLPAIKLNEDNLRVYPLDKGAKARVKIYGSPPPYEPPDYVIL